MYWEVAKRQQEAVTPAHIAKVLEIVLRDRKFIVPCCMYISYIDTDTDQML